MKWLPALVLLGGAISSCRQDMHDQAKLEPYESSTFFADGRAVRPQVEGTVARGQLQLDDHYFRGRQAGEIATKFPADVTLDESLLARGRERYDIFCAICHGNTGDGQGMAVRRGVKAPPSLHIDRLRESPPGYYFDVITNGFGAMYDYADRVPPADRWAITAYIQALQLSQNVPLADLTAEERSQLPEVDR